MWIVFNQGGERKEKKDLLCLLCAILIDKTVVSP